MTTPGDAQLVAEGYARAKALTRRHSKSFFFSSIALFGARRRGAFALYAFCRRLDDLVDGDNAGDGSVVAPDEPVSALAQRLGDARSLVSSLYRPDVQGPALALPWHEAELAAFRDTVARFHIPERPLQELIAGMEMDLTKQRYATFEELRLYCYRVAGVVGELMTPVLGYVDERCLPYAVDLGVAMQLTNILRDVKEDLERGRVYLPADELSAFGLSEYALLRAAQGGPLPAQWRPFMQVQVARARALFERALLGVPDLRGFGSQRLVRLMGAVYSGILDVIEARDFDVFSGRASLPTSGKVARAMRVFFTPTPRPVAALPAFTGGTTS
ncbi:MAG: phytoene/squalene synthase family protein [Myxococcaceae bacterium]|nr:phytoene/squalene synthase family protein [Myxococcaceae bacterium]